MDSAIVIRLHNNSNRYEYEHRRLYCRQNECVCLEVILLLAPFREWATLLQRQKFTSLKHAFYTDYIQWQQ